MAPEGTAFAQVSVSATALAAGATFHVDSGTLERGPFSTPTPTPTPTLTPAPTPQPQTFVFEQLTNGGFELCLFGWSHVGGFVADAVGFGADGRGSILTSQSDSTKSLYQTVRVTPGQWYEASGRLRPNSDC